MKRAPYGRLIASSGLTLAALLAASCSQEPVECAASAATAPVVEILKENVELQIREKIGGEGEAGLISSSKIRAALGQLNFLIEDVRTSSQDPNSTKRFCSATLRIRFPVEVIKDAEAARSTAELGGLTELADEHDIERRADSFSSDIEFSIQPTDDGSKVFAETETGTTMLNFASEVLVSALMRSTVEQLARASDAASAGRAGPPDSRATAPRKEARSRNPAPQRAPARRPVEDDL